MRLRTCGQFSWKIRNFNVKTPVLVLPSRQSISPHQIVMGGNINQPRSQVDHGHATRYNPDINTTH